MAATVFYHISRIGRATANAPQYLYLISDQSYMYFRQTINITLKYNQIARKNKIIIIET